MAAELAGSAAVDEAELHDLIDGRLAPARRRSVLTRLRHDPAMRTRLRAYRAQIVGLTLLYGAAAAEPVPARLAALIASARTLMC